MLGAAMPKAAVDEDGHPRRWEGDIDAPAFVGQDWSVHSIAQTSGM